MSREIHRSSNCPLPLSGFPPSCKQQLCWTNSDIQHVEKSPKTRSCFGFLWVLDKRNVRTVPWRHYTSTSPTRYFPRLRSAAKHRLHVRLELKCLWLEGLIKLKRTRASNKEIFSRINVDLFFVVLFTCLLTGLIPLTTKYVNQTLKGTWHCSSTRILKMHYFWRK